MRKFWTSFGLYLLPPSCCRLWNKEPIHNLAPVSQSSNFHARLLLENLILVLPPREVPSSSDLRWEVLRKICTASFLHAPKWTYQWKIWKVSRVLANSSCGSVPYPRNGSGKPNFSCAFCDKDHFLYLCDDFKLLKVQKCTNFVHYVGYCYECLGGRHDTRDRRSSRTCKCGRAHPLSFVWSWAEIWKYQYEQVAPNLSKSYRSTPSLHPLRLHLALKTPNTTGRSRFNPQTGLRSMFADRMILFPSP